MRAIINAYNIIHSLTFESIDKYILKKEYRLRGFNNFRDKAIKSSYLYNVIDRRLKDNILSNDDWEHTGDLINKIESKKGLHESYDVCKYERKPYDLWFANKNLCTFYENWEKLAYYVCEVFHINVEMEPVICDILVDISSTEVECITTTEIEAQKIECETNTEVISEKITCDTSYDIKAEAEQCKINTEISSEEVSCENKVDLKAYAELCSMKYNIDVDLVTCIIEEAFPNIVKLNNICAEEINLNNTIIEVETEETEE